MGKLELKPPSPPPGNAPARVLHHYVLVRVITSQMITNRRPAVTKLAIRSVWNVLAHYAATPRVDHTTMLKPDSITHEVQISENVKGIGTHYPSKIENPL